MLTCTMPGVLWEKSQTKHNDMSRLILCIDGGGIRGAAATQFLARTEQALQTQHQLSLRDRVDFYAGTSTGAIIALALATTNLSMKKINALYNERNARTIFTENRGFLEWDGVNAPKYESAGKTRVLKEYFANATLQQAVASHRHAMAITYGVEYHQPVIIKSTEPHHLGLSSAAIADASTAAPTYFPSRPLLFPPDNQTRWLIDGGVVANNPAMCALAEVRRLWADTPLNSIRMISVGTGKQARKTNGPASQKWGALQWMRQGHLIDVLSDEQLVTYQMLSLLEQGRCIRVNALMREQPGMPNPPDDAMDDISADNIKKLKEMGDLWFTLYGQQTVDLIMDEYNGPSLDAMDPVTGKPALFKKG